MKRLVTGFLGKQAGFTLVEILLAVAVLGIVAAIAVPTVANIRSNSEAKANATEISTVQAAVDAMMSDQELEVVPTVTSASATNDMTSFPGASNALNGDATYGDYLRQATTKCEYYVAANGAISQGDCP
jgi:prepilin-type N-terminal cleavage/methylation domain-containing protein